MSRYKLLINLWLLSFLSFSTLTIQSNSRSWIYRANLLFYSSMETNSVWFGHSLYPCSLGWEACPCGTLSVTWSLHMVTTLPGSPKRITWEQFLWIEFSFLKNSSIFYNLVKVKEGQYSSPRGGTFFISEITYSVMKSLCKGRGLDWVDLKEVELCSSLTSLPCLTLLQLWTGLLTNGIKVAKNKQTNEQRRSAKE